MLLFPTFYPKLDTSSGGITFVSYQNLNFSTQLHGGFGSLSVEIFGTRDDVVLRYRDFLAYHVVVYDLWGRRVYEGRVWDVSLHPNMIRVNAEGYYACGNEEILGYIYSTPTTVSEVIWDCVGRVDGSGDNSVWRESSAHIASDANIDITAFGPKDYLDTKIRDVIEDVCKLGYRTADARPLYFAIWEHRLPHLWAEPVIHNTADVRARGRNYWYLSQANLVDPEYSRSRDTVYNNVYGMYDGPAGMVLTDPATNPTSIWRFGKRTGVISVGQIADWVAEGLRDYAISTYSYPRQIYRFGVRGFIQGAGGVVDYPFKIRAGDVICVTSFDPYVNQLEGEAGEATSGIAGMVTSTSYSDDDSILRVELTTKDTRIDALLARLGLGGGLS